MLTVQPKWYRTLFGMMALLVATPAYAQSQTAKADASEQDWVQSAPAQPQPSDNGAGAGRVAGSSVGRVGQRRARDQVPTVEPMVRISTRIQNRVETRIQNRIDPSFDPNAPTTAFTKAEAESRGRSQGRRKP